MDFREELRNIVDSVPGAVAGMLAAKDGVLVDAHVNTDEGGALEEIGAEFSAVLQQLERVADSLGYGGLREFTLSTPRYDMLFHPCGENFFLVMLVQPQGFAGKARFLMRLLSPRMQADL